MNNSIVNCYLEERDFLLNTIQIQADDFKNAKDAFFKLKEPYLVIDSIVEDDSMLCFECIEIDSLGKKIHLFYEMKEEV